MDHAEVLARIADAAATPRGLERLEADDSPDGAALHRHLETCPDCRAELVAWQLTSVALLDAAPETLRAPADARERILGAVVREGVPRGTPAVGGVIAPTAVVAGAPTAAHAPAAPGTAAALGIPAAGAPPQPVVPVPLHRDDIARVPLAVGTPRLANRPSPVRFRRLALAAAAVLVIFVAGAVLGPPLGLTPKDGSVGALVDAVAASDQILQQPGHREAVLTRSDGTSAGSVLVNPSTGDIVVFSSELDSDSSSDYHCYLVRDGGPAMWIGPMLTQDGTSYWAGTVTTVADLGKPGDIVQVTDGGSEPDLTATF